MSNEIQIAPQRPTLVDRIQSAWNGWFGPGTPVPPVAPSGTQPRQYDYPLAINQTWMPRAGEKVGFPHLRMLADGNYLIRALIDRIKARVTTKGWHFRLKPLPGEYLAHTKDRSNQDYRVAYLTRFFESPDSEHDFSEWLSMLLEDKLVIDAATLEVQRTRGGGIVNLLPIDGATINILVDVNGRRPRAPMLAYRQIIKGLPAVSMVDGIPDSPDHAQVLYMPSHVRTHRLYGLSPVEETASIIMTMIYKTAFHQDFYSDSDIPLSYMQMPENMSTPEMIRLVREMESAMAGSLQQRMRIYPVPFGSEIKLLKVEEFNGLLEEWCARIFCYVLGETATPFIKQNNRATAQQADDTREESGEAPLLAWIKGRIDRMVQRHDVFNAPDIEFVWDEEAETNPLIQAQVDQINVAIHTRTPNELRQRDGLSPIDGGDSFPLAPAPGKQPGPNEDEVAPNADPSGDDDGNDDDPLPGKKPKTPPMLSAKAATQKKTSFRY